MRIKSWRFFMIMALVGVVLWGAAQSRPAIAEDMPESAQVSGLVGHAQSYMLSCESRSAADLAAFWGIGVSETEFLSQLPGSDNPEVGFVGNPNGMWGGVPPNSYGVYAGPVAELLRAYGLDAEDQRGMSWDDLRAEIVAGRPVIVWVIGSMWNGVPRTYNAEDGSEVAVAAFEHTMILVGYDSAQVDAVDASTGWTQSYALDAFLRSWEVLGNMAVTARGSESDESPPEESGEQEQSQPEGDTYTVQRGDYLMALARQWGVAWEELAGMNQISYPYIIYPGQVLKVPGGEAAEPPPIEAPPPTDTPLPPTPMPTITPMPTPNATVIARLLLDTPYRILFPQVYYHFEPLSASGICLYIRQGVLRVDTYTSGLGWCLRAEQINPAWFYGLAGAVPTLP